MNSLASLNSYILSNECSGLNIAGEGNVSGVFTGGSPAISQEGDPEMIIYVKFREKISVSQIRIELGMREESRPDTVKIYANKMDLDFDDAENLVPTETFNLQEDAGKKINVKVAKFRNVSDISLYFNKNEGSAIQVNCIEFYGVMNEKNVDFAELKKTQVG